MKRRIVNKRSSTASGSGGRPALPPLAPASRLRLFLLCHPSHPLFHRSISSADKTTAAAADAASSLSPRFAICSPLAIAMTSTRASARFSTCSGAPSLQPSLAPTLSSTPSARDSRLLDSALTLVPPPASSKAADVQQWSGALARMQDARLDRQRYVMSSCKDDEMSTLALTAKLERALARRMSGQDAVFSDARLRRARATAPAVAAARQFDSAVREKAAVAAAALDAEKRAYWEVQAAE